MRVINEIIACCSAFVLMAAHPPLQPSPRTPLYVGKAALATPDFRKQDDDAMTKPPVSNLPFAKGRIFHTLDEYLAWREQLGAVDIAWYRKVAPDIYELQTNMRPMPEKTHFTRAELERQFGFAPSR